MNTKSNPYNYGILLILLAYLSFGILDTIQKTAVNIIQFFNFYLLSIYFVYYFHFLLLEKIK